MGTPDSVWGALHPQGLSALCIAVVRHRIARGSPLKRTIYRLLERLGPYYDVELDGAKLRLRANDNATETISLVYGMKRHEGLAKVLGLLRPGETLIDIGANCGLLTVLAAKQVGPSGRVLAIEPLPAMLDRLRFNVETNDVTNVTIVPVALGDQSGEATLHVVAHQHGRSSFHKPKDTTYKISVPVEPLLSILNEYGAGRIDVLKIDVEGYEDRVLLPFFASAPEMLWPRTILTENNERCINALLGYAYKVVWQDRLDTLLTHQSVRL